ncbi:hypothetical protein BJ508DRAFT_410229 [Ascobolus immersus RN42]|uniref:Photolyase/cryptochrome alpha/beta domain-containing protein n=1 Tax=Ascobolus immersus RN42 TaxID=1160509 RepID=A0A3N4IT81_ASCIM|nr:hypothetical protein BJ508DRAFT_410229 [Ascobolus immersus RN42]
MPGRRQTRVSSFLLGKREREQTPDGINKAIKLSTLVPLKQETIAASPLNADQKADPKPFVLRKYYPPEMSNERAQLYNSNVIPRPIEVLEAALKDTSALRNKVPVGDSVIHWFRGDLRLRDNKALSWADEKARSKDGTNLVAAFFISPEDMDAHVRSPARVDFVLRSLQVLKDDLKALNIPLHVGWVDKRKDMCAAVIKFAQDCRANHISANIEYEVDELRKDAKLVKEAASCGINYNVLHDYCAVPPGKLSTGQGKQYSVYTPWYKSWLKYLDMNRELLDELPIPSPNTSVACSKYEHLFQETIPEAPDFKKLPDKETAVRLQDMWPAGEAKAMDRLEAWLNAKALTDYHENRNIPSIDGTSKLSVHFAVGTLSVRTAVRLAMQRNGNKLSGGNKGISCWISEVAWRDFYKHVLVNWPYVCMNKPFKPEYTNIEWDYDPELFDRWCKGMTGCPIVDAAMRQLATDKWMHNRCRMIVGSYLAKDLLLDWRLGEKFFMEHLIDGDFASNNGGWGFVSSAGVDPQPYFRIFNPDLQSKKFDPSGDFIRKWVPELRSVVGNAIHDPWSKLGAKACTKLGYPKPAVVHGPAREKALARYKAGLGRDKP